MHNKLKKGIKIKKNLQSVQFTPLASLSINHITLSKHKLHHILLRGVYTPSQRELRLSYTNLDLSAKSSLSNERKKNGLLLKVPNKVAILYHTQKQNKTHIT